VTAGLRALCSRVLRNAGIPPTGHERRQSVSVKMQNEDKKSKSQNVDVVRNLDFVEQYGKFESQSSNIKGELLKFIKGCWYAGPDQTPVELGTRMVVNGDSMMLGWQLWQDERVVDYVMGKLVETFQPPKREDLSFPPDVKTGKNAEWPLDDNGNLSDPWRYTVQVLMKDEDGELYTFSIGSKGGRTALGKVCLAWSQKMREGVDNVYPVVELGADTYKHKKYSLIDIPVLEVVDWSPIEDFGSETEEEPKVATRALRPTTLMPKAPGSRSAANAILLCRRAGHEPQATTRGERLRPEVRRHH
jgi:hypothetical protein